MMTILARLGCIYGWGESQVAKLAPLLALAARLYVARAFFLSGLTKIRDWDTTLLLFTEEYHVPILAPAVAAPLATAGELVLPVLLVLGLFGRFAAAGLFVVNIVAVISYPDLGAAEIKDHVLWGVMLVYLVVHGCGAWSLDRFWQRRYTK
ncbi:DoxX family protein [Jeongeupia naejangsanensis]|uniref:DoxX family protein n=1 Tax=Jeongeupia naejangsanensis TaxID=613195 RepID=A0ABS2BNP3_9NEIS|nr:DoxX family protein [Jeongeupia naejangsanensis]MBM3117251.1 DoxX family protein [Jeongeupia naejangsanensis]